jgi:hypothetical protein
MQSFPSLHYVSSVDRAMSCTLTGNSRYGGKAFRAPSGGGNPIAIQPDFASVLYPIWSPDGKQLLFLAACNPEDIPADAFDWWIAPRDGGPAIKTESFILFRSQRIMDGRPSLVVPAGWIGDGVFFSANLEAVTSLWRLNLLPSTGKPAGLPQQLTFGTSLEAKPSVIAGEQIAFASLTQSLNIWSLPVDANLGKVTGDAQKLTDGAHDAHTSLSADGKKLVLTSTRAGNPDVWMKDLATDRETALTVTPVSEEQPEITSDGTRVCYMVPEGQKFAIYGVSTNGDVPERLCEDCGRPWDWSPDGKKILYLVAEGRGKRAQSPMGLALFDIATRQKTAYLEHPQYGLARAHKLRVPDQLRRTLCCTNVIESAFSIVETVCQNVKRWRSGDQIEQWIGSGLLVAERQFRKVIGHRQTPILLSSMANAVSKKGIAKGAAVA